MNQKCPIHPDYKVILPPRSTKPGCICRQIWNEKHAASADEVKSGRERLGGTF